MASQLTLRVAGAKQAASLNLTSSPKAASAARTKLIRKETQTLNRPAKLNPLLPRALKVAQRKRSASRHRYQRKVSQGNLSSLGARVSTGVLLYTTPAQVRPTLYCTHTHSPWAFMFKCRQSSRSSGAVLRSNRYSSNVLVGMKLVVKASCDYGP